MEYGKLVNAPGTYVPETGTEYPKDDPFHRLLKVEVEDESKGKYRFDETFPYLDRSWNYKWNLFKGWFVEWFAVHLINRIKFGLRIRGRRHLRANRKALRHGGMAVCNHVMTFDAVCVNRAVRPFGRVWIPMFAKHFNGSKSWFMRYVGGIPVPENTAGMRKFNEAFDTFHSRGQWMLVFPEAVRWDFYQPIRPFRKGAFTMAYRYGIPVVPCVISYRPRTGIWKLFGDKDLPLLTLTVCPPLIPDTTAPRRAEVDRLREEAHREMVQAAGILENPWPCKPEDD